MAAIFTYFALFLVLPIYYWKRNAFRLENNTPSLIIYFMLLPAMASLLLYYLIFIIPHQSALFYLLGLSSILLVIPLFIKSTQLKPQAKPSFQKADLVLIALLILATLFWFYNLISKPILANDMFQYGAFSQWIASDKEIVYRAYHHNAKTGFTYVGKHGYGFVMFGVLEQLLKEVFTFKNHFLFKVISGHYSMLTLLLSYFIIRRYDAWIALALVFSLLTSIAFLAGLNEFHLDSYRMGLLLTSLFLLVRAVQNKHMVSLALIGGLALGLQAFPHSLNAIIGGLLALAASYCFGVRYTLQVTFWSALLFGGYLHYLIDTFFGTHWIFNFLFS